MSGMAKQQSELGRGGSGGMGCASQPNAKSPNTIIAIKMASIMLAFHPGLAMSRGHPSSGGVSLMHKDDCVTPKRLGEHRACRRSPPA